MTERKKHIMNLLVLLVSCLCIGGALILFASFGYNSDRIVADIQVEIEADVPGQKSLLDTTEVFRIIQGSFPDGLVGRSLKNTDLDVLEEQFEANPFIKEVQLYADKKNILQIHVAERKPLLRVFSLKGANYYIDFDGYPMPLSEHYSARVMTVTGHIPPLKEGEKVDSVKKVFDVFTIANALQSDTFMNGFINEIHVDHQGQILLVPLIGDFRIEISETKEIDEKIENLKIFLKEGLSRVGWDKYSKLSIDYKNQIVGKKSLNP